MSTCSPEFRSFVSVL
uniref:Uncharacterized protein n=1 Tax=Arundo donax TaxID=35708 RepID=A0A0A9HWN0_ARUDO